MSRIRFRARIRWKCPRQAWIGCCATPEHFARFVDNRVKVELAAPRDGRKRYTGMLRRADGESIELEVDNFSVSIRLAEIGKARLAPL